MENNTSTTDKVMTTQQTSLPNTTNHTEGNKATIPPTTTSPTAHTATNAPVPAPSPQAVPATPPQAVPATPPQTAHAEGTPVEVSTDANAQAAPPPPTFLQRAWRQIIRIPLYIRWRISYILRSENFLTSTFLGIMMLFFVSFFIWAYNCTIEKTVKAQGVVMAIMENQIVSHLEGGVIKTIYVAQGDKVKEGDALLEVINMDILRDKDRYLVKKQYTQAVLRRLYAERDHIDMQIADSERRSNSDIVQQYEVQMQNREALQDTISILQTQRDKLLAEKATKITQRKNLKIELDLATQQVTMLEPLVKEGIGSMQNLLQRQAEMAKLNTSVDDLAHTISTLDINIREAEEKITEEESMFLKKVQEEIATNTNELHVILSELESLDASIQRNTLRAPISGTVHKMYTSTIGGIVRAGDPLIEIVPEATSIRIEAKVQPQDRTNIYNHQEAKVRPTSYSFSLDTMLLVDITSISAQTFFDDQTRNHYYKVFLQSKHMPETEEEKARYKSFMPGMIVEVNILSGEESLLHYLFTPIIRGLNNALTERPTR